MTRAKRRSAAQRIGRQGELIFEAWANAGNFTASKLQEDYGVDFVCQQLAPTGNSAEEITGLSAFVQVRATSTNVRPRIGLSREDVETAIRQTGVFCVAGVHIPTKEVFFRWLDISMLNEWSAFLRSGQETTTILLDSMSKGIARFSDELALNSRPACRAKFAQALVRLNLEAAMPGARLSMNAGAYGDWAAVVVPNMFSILNIGADKHEMLASVVFRPTPFESVFQEALSRQAPHQALLSVGDLVDGPLLIAGGTDGEVTLEIESGSKKLHCTFTLRRIRDERAYIGSSGLVLRITDARKSLSSNEHVHQISWSLEGEGAKDLPSSGQLDFLRLLVPGARLNEKGRDLIPIEQLGIQSIGRSIAAIELVYSRLGLPLTGVKLTDLCDETFALNLGVLEAILNQSNPIIPGFVINLSEDEITEIQWTPIRYKVPIALQMKGNKILVWVQGNANACFRDGELAGVRFISQDAADIELADYPLSGDGRATAHFVPGLLSIDLTLKNPELGESSKGFPYLATFMRRQSNDCSNEPN